MAHIISCMAETDDPSANIKSYIDPPSPTLTDDQSPSIAPSDKPFVWRMHQPERKYQLFPKGKEQATPAPAKGLNPEQAFALAMSQNQSQNEEKTDKPAAGGGLRLRIKEHNLIRRRKVSVPELGPMTTVHEVPMDSPTIPGRPPLHERSISAPHHSWKQHHLVECMTHSPVEESVVEQTATFLTESPSSIKEARQPLSPKVLAPLVIPDRDTRPRLTKQLSLSRLRSATSPGDTLTARSDSPKARTPFTPFTPLSASTVATTSTLPTPISAAIPPESARASPKPWAESSTPAAATPRETTPEPHATPKAETEPRVAKPILGHRRGQSESGSIMERGRPRKRNHSREASTGSLARSSSKRATSAERKAFQTLPKGWKAEEASTMLAQSELAAVQRQALQQAARFEVLRKEDVDNLSKELRHLDERTDYLRRTYTSLRAGRRNLHSRICHYLRSPRTAKFSADSMLKQEEALADLDNSIDDWVSKLEQAENRRTRVRQKLLEHVAAAATLPSAFSAGANNTNNGLFGVSESLQLAMGVRPSPQVPANVSTPPRSPTKMMFSSQAASSTSPSPHRAVVARVPSAILEQPVEDANSSPRQPVGFGSPPQRASVLRRMESIRIYAGDDVYALLADVESEITKMGAPELAAEKAADDISLTNEEKTKLHRAHSHELLSGGRKKASPPPSPTTDSDGEMLLTNAVFRP